MLSEFGGNYDCSGVSMGFYATISGVEVQDKLEGQETRFWTCRIGCSLSRQPSGFKRYLIGTICIILGTRTDSSSQCDISPIEDESTLCIGYVDMFPTALNRVKGMNVRLRTLRSTE